tara:strand:+ start:316 stop:2013 length:1698 start_codon:yes stop_codon:yes gene_type:complete
LRDSYQAELTRAANLRGGALWYPYIGSGIGHGALVELADGSVKYDFISGIGVHYYGHSHHDMLDAGINAALADTIQQGHLQQNTDSVDSMESIVNLARKNGAAIDTCFLSTSGAMANENALNFLFQKHQTADRTLCFHKCFSGCILALAQMTDKAAFRAGLPNSMAVDYVPFCDESRPEESTREAVVALKAHLMRFPRKYAAMCLELVQGEDGYYPGSTPFFEALIDVLKANNVAVWIDEIQTFGRLSEAFVFQYFGLDKHVDMVTIGKMSQVCATLFGEGFKAKPGLLSQTFTSSGHAIRAAQKLVDRLYDGDLTSADGKNMQLHKVWAERCTKIDGLRGSYGIGAMFAMTVLDGTMPQAKDFCSRLFGNGVIGFVAGANPTRVRFLPRDEAEPFIGPLISSASADIALAAQAELESQGAKVLVRLGRSERSSALVSPGIIDVTSVENRSDEEVFAPLHQVIRVDTYEDALVEANATEYGLSAGLVSDSTELYQQFLETSSAGIINWNRQITGAVSSAPFGGSGKSGNFRPGASLAADYCAYPVASIECPNLVLPATLSPGINF